MSSHLGPQPSLATRYSRILHPILNLALASFGLSLLSRLRRSNPSLFGPFPSWSRLLITTSLLDSAICISRPISSCAIVESRHTVEQMSNSLRHPAFPECPTQAPHGYALLVMLPGDSLTI